VPSINDPGADKALVSVYINFERRVLSGKNVMCRNLNLQKRHPLVVLGSHYEQK
jgi:hypothetical protein